MNAIFICWCCAQIPELLQFPKVYITYIHVVMSCMLVSRHNQILSFSVFTSTELWMYHTRLCCCLDCWFGVPLSLTKPNGGQSIQRNSATSYHCILYYSVFLPWNTSI